MIQIRKEEHQKKQKEKKLKVYKVNTHKKTVIALWVLLAVSSCATAVPNRPMPITRKDFISVSPLDNCLIYFTIKASSRKMPKM